MELVFTKMHGAGNDFVVVDGRHGDVPWQDAPRMAALARRRTGIGCEGIIIIRNEELGIGNGGADFKMVFLNPDGHPAAMCGNGARCAAFFAYRKGIAGRYQRIQTAAGIIEAEILDASQDRATVRITVATPSPPVVKRIKVAATSPSPSENEWECHCLNTGVPHAVVFVDDVETINVKKIGSTLRWHEAFAPEGTNVNFVDKHLNVRTYERGVEDESGACGTGAIATALVLAQQQGLPEPWTQPLKTRMGETLTVSQHNGRLTLTGSAVVVFEGCMTNCRG